MTDRRTTTTTRRRAGLTWADLTGEEKLCVSAGWKPDAPELGPCRWSDYAGLLEVWDQVRESAFVAVPVMEWWAERLRTYVEAYGIESLDAVKWGDPGCLDLYDETEDGLSPPAEGDDDDGR